MSATGLHLGEMAAPNTPDAGYQAIYLDNVSYPRLMHEDHAGNKWPVCDILTMCLAADYLLANSTTAQKAFNGSTNGAIALPSNSGYEFEAQYLIANTGTAGHTWATLFDTNNGATITSLDYSVSGRSGITSALTLGADSSCFQNNAAGSFPTTALVATASSTSATEFVILKLKGAMRIATGGNVIPQIKLSTATGVAATMKRGSYIKFTPIGSDAATSLGTWS